MYNLIVVDDHSYISERLATFLVGNDMSVNLVDVAKDGKDGLDKIIDQKPDIVITDIDMPIMNGLAMITKAVECGVKTNFIVLTGYDEFDYAQKSVTLGVLEYLLKPVRPMDIMDALKRAVLKLGAERKKQEEFDLIKARLNESIPILTEKFLEDLIDGLYIDRDEVTEHAEYLKLNFKNKVFTVVTARIDNYGHFLKQHEEEERQLIKFSISYLIQNIFKDHIYDGTFKKDGARFLLSFDQNDVLPEEKLISILQRIINDCRNNYKTNVSFGVGDYVSNIMDINKSGMQSAESLKYKTVFGNCSVILYKDIVHTQTVDSVIRYYDITHLSDGLKMRSEDMVMACVHQLFEGIRKQSVLHSNYIKILVCEMITVATATIYSMGEKLPDNLLNEFLNQKPVWGLFDENMSLEELEQATTQFFAAVFLIIDTKTNHRNLRIVEQMQEYIHSNYSKEISMQDLSKSIFLTSNYLGNIFKKITGKTFNESLAEFRIEKAKQLLSTGNYKIYQVCDMVGYKNLDHFRLLFKKYTGINPSFWK